MVRARRPSAQTILLFSALARQPTAWRYGYDLTQEIGVASGTLYPLLIRLHQKGWLAAEWRPSDKPGRPPRHAYRLTAAGLAQARSVLATDPAEISARPAVVTP